MSNMPLATKKRKACQSCTHSKAKCSPFEDRSDLCYRCQRLGKNCVFEDTVRKRAPKSRSRVKQLEQRVDTLIDLLSSNGQHVGVAQPAKGVSHLPIATGEETPLPTAFDVSENAQQSAPYITPEETPSRCYFDEEPFEPYDPVEAGVLTQDSASKLLKEFGKSFIQSFPFVMIPVTTDSDALRTNSPFLFHSIMTVTSYRTPATQRILAEELKEQIATRIIRRSHKSLEILQGLLIYGAWYHFFYIPSKQQIATIMQLCVAMVQDLSLAKNPKERTRKLTPSEQDAGSILNTERVFAERRAFLGAYYLAVAFAQAWRKRSTMRRTRYMTQCCRLLAERKEHPSDELITPLIELSELTCRVNDYFSYDDMDNAEVNGEMMLSFTTLNFRSELDRIRNSLTADAKRNKNLYLGICLVEIWVYECALHGTFWNSPSPSEPSTISVSRSVALYHCMNAMNSYLNALIGIPQDSLHHLAFPSWSGWFYAIIVACKLVFLEDNERRSQTDLDSVSHEVDKLVSDDHFEKPMSYEPCTLPVGVNATSVWDPIAVAREAGVQSLFDRFIQKMEFTIPCDPNALNGNNPMCDPLFSMIALQRSLLHGFTKRMKEHVSKLKAPEATTTSVQSTTSSLEDISGATCFPDYDHLPTMTPQAQHLFEQERTNPIPFMNNFHFNSINFDTIAPSDSLPLPQSSQDDLLWDAVMDDFSFPI